MRAHLFMGTPVLKEVELDEIELDANGLLQSARLVGIPRDQMMVIAFNPATRLNFEGKRYRIDVKQDGSLTASLD